jgi:NAD(P)-dependent dehydrogenase (short-subunit alcohol dehydrogenase family)
VRLFDMTDRDACRQALTGCFADLIILCAGTCEYLDHGQVDAALVERVMATNFLGPVNCLAALQTQLEVQRSWCWSARWRTGCPSRARKPMAPPKRR